MASPRKHLSAIATRGPFHVYFPVKPLKKLKRKRTTSSSYHAYSDSDTSAAPAAPEPPNPSAQTRFPPIEAYPDGSTASQIFPPSQSALSCVPGSLKIPTHVLPQFRAARLTSSSCTSDPEAFIKIVDARLGIIMTETLRNPSQTQKCKCLPNKPSKRHNKRGKTPIAAVNATYIRPPRILRRVPRFSVLQRPKYTYAM